MGRQSTPDGPDLVMDRVLNGHDGASTGTVRTAPLIPWVPPDDTLTGPGAVHSGRTGRPVTDV